MKRKFQTIIGIFLATVTFGILAACGGGGGSGPTAATTATGRFVDGPVAGMGYNSGAHSGVTGADGSFTYEVGKTVKFFVGDIVLGVSPARSALTPIHLVPGSNAATPEVVAIVRFLMSIGTVDPNTGQITIPPAVLAAAKGKTVDFATVTDDVLLALVKELTQNPNATLVDPATAITHLEKSIWKEYGGLFTGVFMGPASANTWEMTIDLNGNVTGKGDNNEGLSGTMTAGTLFVGTAQFGCTIKGTLDLNTGVFSGEWQYPLDLSIKGTFTGTRK